jgi:hypothetical protein
MRFLTVIIGCKPVWVNRTAVRPATDLVNRRPEVIFNYSAPSAEKAFHTPAQPQCLLFPSLKARFISISAIGEINETKKGA